MNLILLFPEDFTGEDTVRLTGRRIEHVANVHRAAAGDELVVGVVGGKIGRGVVTHIDGGRRDVARPAGEDASVPAEPPHLEMRVTLEREPPSPLPVTLVLALPRPKVLNRVIASVTSLGVKRIILVNAWRVEKSYWKSPRLSDENLMQQRVLGLEQARDTILPEITTRRFFRPFVEDELPAIAAGSLGLVAHPVAAVECPRNVRRAVTLVIGPEGGFIAEEIASLERIGFTPVSLGARILRVETAVAALLARLY